MGKQKEFLDEVLTIGSPPVLSNFNVGEVHVVEVGLVLLHPALVPTDGLQTRTLAHVSHKDVVHLVDSNPPGLIQAWFTQSGQTQCTIGMEDVRNHCK